MLISKLPYLLRNHEIWHSICSNLKLVQIRFLPLEFPMDSSFRTLVEFRGILSEFGCRQQSPGGMWNKFGGLVILLTFQLRHKAIYEHVDILKPKMTPFGIFVYCNLRLTMTVWDFWQRQFGCLCYHWCMFAVGLVWSPLEGACPRFLAWSGYSLFSSINISVLMNPVIQYSKFGFY